LPALSVLRRPGTDADRPDPHPALGNQIAVDDVRRARVLRTPRRDPLIASPASARRSSTGCAASPPRHGAQHGAS
jgi:hypothetical protein